MIDYPLLLCTSCKCTVGRGPTGNLVVCRKCHDQIVRGVKAETLEGAALVADRRAIQGPTDHLGDFDCGWARCAGLIARHIRAMKPEAETTSVSGIKCEVCGKVAHHKYKAMIQTGNLGSANGYVVFVHRAEDVGREIDNHCFWAVEELT